MTTASPTQQSPLTAQQWEGIIADAVPSDNAQRRWHFAHAKREQEAWFWKLRAALHHVPKATGFRRVTITRFAHGLFDVGDNLGGAHKSLVRDLLRPMKRESGIYKSGKRKGEPWARESIGLGLIIGDGPKEAEFVYMQVRISRKLSPYTIVTIQEAPDGATEAHDRRT